MADAADDTLFFDNQPVSPDGDYTYDALYRLIQAKGREHPGQQPRPSDYTRYSLPHANNTDALINYTQTYGYDEVGNIVQMRETVGSTWTQDYSYAGDSNRLSTTTIGQTTLNYSHDAHGNMGLPHLTVQTWDFMNQLRSTSKQSVGSGTPETTYYIYNGAGERVRKVTKRLPQGIKMTHEGKHYAVEHKLIDIE